MEDAGESGAGGIPLNLYIKKDPDEFSDKVIQFTLALQRQSVTEVIDVDNTTYEPNTINPPRPTPSIQYVDLTLSDEEEFDSAAEKDLDQNDSWIDLSSQERIKNNTVLRQNSSTPHSSSKCISPSPSHNDNDVEDEEMNYEAAMSSLELQLEEAEEGYVNGFEIGEDDDRPPRRSLPYTEEEKALALEGNKDFDYRTRLDEHGEEKYAIFKCPKCPTGFPRMHHYLVHLRSHGRIAGNANYKCPECDLMTANSTFLANHMERHLLQREPQLFDMELGRMRPSPWEKEKRTMSDTSPIRVSKRPKTNPDSPPQDIRGQSASSRRDSTPLPDSPQFQDLNESGEIGNEIDRQEARKGNPNFVYRAGRRSHANGRVYERTSYKCQQCPYSHEKYELYLSHLEGHREQRPFPCDQCSYSTTSHVNLDRHAALHQNQPSNSNSVIKQNVSGDDMDDTSWRDTTMSISTNGRTGSSRSRPSTGAVQCPKCPSKLSGSLNLRIHLKQHGKLGMKLNCPHCDYASNRDDYMRNHIEAHLNDGESDDRETLVTNSIGTSTNVPRPENLSEEDYSKLINGNPRFLYMTTSPTGQALPLDSSYKCWDCPYATIKFNLLLAHQRRHDANAKYGCNKCSYSANTIQGLKNHKLAHTVQHTAARKTVNGQPISFHGETPQSPPLALPENLMERPESGQFFISNIRILNIMAMNEEPTVAEVSTHGILKLKGNSEEGKSSYILAVMLGLGYDLCLDRRDATTSICGLNLKNAISDGRDYGSVELIVSLRAFPELQKEFGSQIKFSRRMTRAPTDLSNMVVITSADPRPQFKNTHPKVLGGKDLACFLRKLKLSPERLRLMLLDGENVKYMMDNQPLWYHLFEVAIKESEIDVVQKTTETKFLLQRLRGRERLQRERLEWFQSRLEMRPPLDSEKIRQVGEEDWQNHRKCTTEMNQLGKEKQDLEEKLKNYSEQGRGGTEWYIARMRSIFDKYLEQLNYNGEIMVVEGRRELGICIWKLSSKEVRPTTIDGVNAMWKTLSNGKKHIAVIGLYLALWEISSYLGILAADAFSCTETDFHVPPGGLPVLWELLNRKCTEQKQCIISLPPDY